MMLWLKVIGIGLLALWIVAQGVHHATMSDDAEWIESTPTESQTE